MFWREGKVWVYRCEACYFQCGSPVWALLAKVRLIHLRVRHTLRL